MRPRCLVKVINGYTGKGMEEVGGGLFFYVTQCLMVEGSVVGGSKVRRRGEVVVVT